MLDAEGPDALSMRRLAARLGVAPMSIYHHVADKAALVEAIAEAITDELAEPAPGISWDEMLDLMSHSFRDLTRAHPAVFRVLLSGERPAALMRTVDTVVARLVDHGFSEDDAVDTFRTFIRYLLGVIVIEADARLTKSELDSAFDSGIALLVRGTAALRLD